MNESKPPSEPATPESLWRSLDRNEESNREIAFTPDRLCAMARSRRRESIWSRRILLAILIVLVGAFARNLFSIREPWLRLSQGWMLTWTCLLLWRFRHVSPGTAATESCASFLAREFESKRRGFQEIRRYLFLLLPPILISWWRRGPALRLRVWGVDPSSRVYSFTNGPWPFLILGLTLVLIWTAFGLAAQKATDEIDDLRRRTQQ